MKILKMPQDNPTAWKTKETCTGRGWEQNGRVPCGALLEVAGVDIRYRIYTDISGDSEVYYGFICPLCGCFTELSTRKIPPYVRNNATRY